jgi:hypothetical protein
MTGTPFFLGGCGVAMALFEKRVAIASILYLIIGDMTAVSTLVSPPFNSLHVRLPFVWEDFQNSYIGAVPLPWMVQSLPCLAVVRHTLSQVCSPSWQGCSLSSPSWQGCSLSSPSWQGCSLSSPSWQGCSFSRPRSWHGGPATLVNWI